MKKVVISILVTMFASIATSSVEASSGSLVLSLPHLERPDTLFYVRERVVCDQQIAESFWYRRRILVTAMKQEIPDLRSDIMPQEILLHCDGIEVLFNLVIADTEGVASLRLTVDGTEEPLSLLLLVHQLVSAMNARGPGWGGRTD